MSALTQLYSSLETLPPEYVPEVYNFVEFLKTKEKKQSIWTAEEKEKMNREIRTLAEEWSKIWTKEETEKFDRDIEEMFGQIDDEIFEQTRE